MSLINRNVSIVVALLVVVVIVAYLIWLRSKVSLPVSPKIEEQQVEVTSSPEPTSVATPSAVASPETTGSAKPKTATSGASKK